MRGHEAFLLPDPSGGWHARCLTCGWQFWTGAGQDARAALRRHQREVAAARS